MKGLHGLANTDIHSAAVALEKQGLNVQLYVYPDKVKDTTDVLLICNSGVFNNMMDDLGNTDVCVLLFDSAIRLDSYIGMTVWDVAARKQSFRFEFCTPSFTKMAKVLKEELADTDSVVPCHSGINVAAHLLNTTPNSYLATLQTWKYKIKDTHVREEAFNYFIDWLFNPAQSKENLLAHLEKITGKDKASSILFASDVFLKIKEVLIDVKTKRDAGKTVTMSKVAEKASLSTFDLQYLYNSYTKRQEVTNDVTLETIFHANKKASVAKAKAKAEEELENDD